MCGRHKNMENIKQLNPILETDSNLVHWKRWELVKKANVGMTKMDIVFKETTKWKLFQQYIADLEGMALHLFHKYWQNAQFRNIQTNLEKGYFLQVMDFAQNFIHKYQDEPQPVHWHHQQTAMHPTVNYSQM